MPHTSYPKIKTDEDLRETQAHGSREYPFQFYDETMSMFDFGTIDWHWHAELEFVYVERGEVQVSVGTDTFVVKQGQGLFINTKELHYFYAEDDAVIPNFLFPAAFIAPIESLIYQKYAEPVLTYGSSSIVFRSDIPWQSQTIEAMKKIIALQRSPVPDEFETFRAVCDLWDLLAQNITEKAVSTSGRRETASKARLLLMMQFIHDSYAAPITLEEIASQAAVSKSTALSLFRKFLRTTPVDYLISYRLNQAALLLAQTEEKVGAISLKTGFVNVDYFCRAFKRHYSMTPSQYRHLHS